MKNDFIIKLLMILFLVINISAKEKKVLLIYCGTTMVKPIKEISKIIEKKYNVKIKISQGGSEDLYKSLTYIKKGDLYLPGSDSYRKDNLKDGYLLDSQYIGFNKAAIFVKKGNPNNVFSLGDFINEKNDVILANPNSGSIGKISKKILIKYKNKKFYNKVYDISVEIGTDSRNLNTSIIRNKGDLTINWRATAFWSENSPFIDIVEINDSFTSKKKLVLNLLSFSKHPKLAKIFMNFAASKEGQEIMKRYGFL